MPFHDARDRAVRMAEEDVADVVALEQGGEILRIVELDQVHQRVADVEGRMVHEEIDGGAAGLREFRRQPCAARRVIKAGGGWRALQRVEEQEVAAIARDGMLHVADASAPPKTSR